MKCDCCKSDEASIHLAQSIDGQVSKVHLCEACALAKGIDIKQTISVTDVLLGLEQGFADSGAEAARSESERICPDCGISRAEYRKRGRLGCASCYEAFRDDLQKLIRSMHYSEQHAGKCPVRRFEGPAEEESVRLYAALQGAIGREDFEEAARLRDLIAQLEMEAAGHGSRTVVE